MAFAVVSKGSPMAGRLRKILAAPCAAAGGESTAFALRTPAAIPARRFFNTGAGGVPLDSDNDGLEDSSDEDIVDDPRRCRLLFGPPGYADMLAMLGLEDAAPGSGVSAKATPRRGWWVAKEDDEAVLLKAAMPGLGKEHVKVWAEKNIVMIKGEGDTDCAFDDKSGPPQYSHRIELPVDGFKMDQIKAEMKNGVLMVTVPKLKVEERKHVFEVKVE